MVLTLTTNAPEYLLRGGIAAHPSGTPSTISGGEPSFNQWAHFAMSFDGSDLRLYLGGIESGVLPGFLFTINFGTIAAIGVAD